MFQDLWHLYIVCHVIMREKFTCVFWPFYILTLLFYWFSALKICFGNQFRNHNQLPAKQPTNVQLFEMAQR